MTQSPEKTIRGYVEFPYYFKAISLAIEKETSEKKIFGRTYIMDIVHKCPECMEALGIYSNLWFMDDHKLKNRDCRPDERRNWTVVGRVMQDLGFEKCSKHSWIRGKHGSQILKSQS